MSKTDLLHAPLTRIAFHGRTVLILGLGQYEKGSGIAAALAFAKLGANLIVTDLKTRKELRDNVNRLKKFSNVQFTLGKHDSRDIEKAELIIANPRVRPVAPEMKLARSLNIPVTSDVGLFLDRCPAPVIAVTGTRGKSTTASLIADMLKRSGKRVWLGGNILVSPLTFLSRVKKNHVVVLELSSWQCESLPNVKAPHIAVITNLMRDHLNTYNGMVDYAEAKAQIFRHQNTKDIAIFNADDAYGRRWSKEAPGLVYCFGKKADDARITSEALWLGNKKLIDRDDIRLIGEHNHLNALAASLAASKAGAKQQAIQQSLKQFKGLPYRLELVANKKGIRYINDTCATTPDGTRAALLALVQQQGDLHFILGGSDKNLEYDNLISEFKKQKARINLYLIPGSATRLLRRGLKKAKIPFKASDDLADAMKAIKQVAQKGDVVILSPGAASFGQFSNEFDRGDTFNKLVRQIS